MKPEFPLHVHSDDGDIEVLATPHEVELSLEWFDSSDGDTSVRVLDNLGRPVRVKVEALKLMICELEEPDVHL